MALHAFGRPTPATTRPTRTAQPCGHWHALRAALRPPAAKVL